MASELSPFTLVVDWLAFTLPDGEPKETMRVLGRDWIEGQTGFRGYPRSWICDDGSGGVGKLGTGAVRRPREVHVDLSGGIVSAWEPNKVRSVLRWIVDQNGHLTRIDCALDDRKMIVPVTMVKEAEQRGQAVTRADRFEVRSSSSLGTGECIGETLYFGSPASQTRLRVYDKRLELLHKGREDWQDYGARWELELRRERADACGRALFWIEQNDWLEFIVMLLRSYVDFRDTTRESETWQRCEAPLLGWWDTLTQGFRKGRLVVEKRERNVEEVKQYVSRSWAPTLAALCASPAAGRGWLDRALMAGEGRWKEKHRRLLQEATPSKGYVLKPEAKATS